MFNLELTLSRARAVIRTLQPQVINQHVRTWQNCRYASVDRDGDIWISDPQTGHWLSAESLSDFVNWLANAGHLTGDGYRVLTDPNAAL